MSIFFPLCSSSSGNCTYIGDKNNGILIDAGIGIRKFKSLILDAGISENAVKAIFITHEHSDHIKGLPQLVKKLNVPVYGTRFALEMLVTKKILSEDSDMYEVCTNKYITEYDMQIESFSTPHDSIESVGYKVTTSDNKKIGFSTDLGYITNEVLFGLSECDFTMIEANYDEHLLEIGSYPHFLKQRIKGDYGHLSNTDCAKAIEKLIKLGTNRFMLGHLSDENNRPDIALSSVLNGLDSAGLNSADFNISVASKFSDGYYITV
jgi:phosphoribosyl 1,2-cyclic phosphodiesterase